MKQLPSWLANKRPVIPFRHRFVGPDFSTLEQVGSSFRDRGLLLHVEFGLLNILDGFFVLRPRYKLIDAGWAAELVSLSTDNPRTRGIRLGHRNRTDLVARLRMHVMFRHESLELL